jgi:hypothetical protein
MATAKRKVERFVLAPRGAPTIRSWILVRLLQLIVIMKSRISNSATLVVCLAATSALLFSSCSTSVNMIEVARGMKERGGDPPPETEWNRLGLWQRVADEPPTYIPTGYSASSPRTETEGTWIVDERDGKRLFVPNEKIGIHTPGAMIGEAKKVTTWTPRNHTTTSPGIMRDGQLVPVEDFISELPQSR